MTTEPNPRPSAEFIDKHMIANVEGVMIHEYLQRRPGVVPTKEELRAFVSGLSDDQVLHPHGNVALEVRLWRR